MKLYLWQDVLCDYTSGCAFAIAESKEEAILLVAGYSGYILDELLAGECEERELDQPFGFSRGGGG